MLEFVLETGLVFFAGIGLGWTADRVNEVVRGD